MSRFLCTIGLEVHVQLQLQSKLFAPSPYAAGGAPNSRVSWIELGLPGVLPQLNDRALDLAIRAGLALEGEICERIHFDRKNYFYPDLPKGYQITQDGAPIVRGGRVPLGDGRHAALDRIHLEEDAGKTTHEGAHSLVDLNRAGAALIEIVSEPVLESPAEAYAYLTQLKQIMQYAEVSECDMEKGLLRCDANISLRRQASDPLGTKVELKNLNSFRHVQKALEYEQRRQAAVLAGGGEVAQETRLWQEERGETKTMRRKEGAADYRYFPDPDLLPLRIDAARIDGVRQAMPELPAAVRARLRETHGLPEYDTEVLLSDRHLVAYFEGVAHACGDAKLASNWVMTEVLRMLKEDGRDVAGCPVSSARLVELIGAQQDGRLSRNAARKVFDALWQEDRPVATWIESLGLAQLSDPTQLEPIIAAVLAEMPQAVAEFRAGKEKALHALQGRVMKATKGRANPSLVQEILRQKLAT